MIFVFLCCTFYDFCVFFVSSQHSSDFSKCLPSSIQFHSHLLHILSGHLLMYFAKKKFLFLNPFSTVLPTKAHVDELLTIW